MINIIKLYKKGNSMNQIGCMFGISRFTVAKILRMNNISSRSGVEAARLSVLIRKGY